MTNGTATQPFTLEPAGDDRVVIRLARHVDEPRLGRPGPDRELQKAFRVHIEIALDFSATVTIASEWISLLGELIQEAEKTGKRVGTVGMADQIRTTADAIALDDAFTHFDSIDDVWQSE